MMTVNMAKLVEAVHFICSKCEASDRLGTVKLNKILYYSDMTHFAEIGSSITGATYEKRQRGPVPKEVLAAIDVLRKSGRLVTRNVSVFDHVRREFDASGQTDLSLFNSTEVERITNMIAFVCGHNASEISELSHTRVWEVADMGEELPYETFLVSHLGDADESDFAIARAALERAKRGEQHYA